MPIAVQVAQSVRTIVFKKPQKKFVVFTPGCGKMI